MASENKLQAVWVPVTRESLEHMTQQFSQACARRDSPLAEVQKLGQNLFSLLVQPVNEELSAKSLIRVELDRSLSSLPFEALRSPEGWYLGEKYPIVYSPGILYERHLRQPANVSSSAPFLLADAAGGSFLPGHDLERSTIQKLFPKATVLGPEANSAAIMTPLGQSAIFGFIGHGEPYATGTGLRMNPHLLLQAENFSPHSLRHLQMAVLAACSTGSSGTDGLLDNRNLVHAFLAGGVPNVVASRWNVDAEATAMLISSFYTNHVGHESAPDALFAARNQILKTKPTYSHPYYWAAFSVTGKVN
ncbi:MAG TPA: CHAT domain-containing protein, partial [Candidatus Angelobacter sp.]|nr:CHAT domain-containing protein [Candidatus Angelobacter sp.]